MSFNFLRNQKVLPSHRFRAGIKTAVYLTTTSGSATIV